MNEIKRYTPEPEFVSGEFDDIEMQERPDGDWVRYEDVADLIAERDPTPVTSEWLDGVMSPAQIGPDGKYTEWSTGDGTCEVTLWRNGPPVMSRKLHNIKINPTRGDVLTAIRLFGGRKRQ